MAMSPAADAATPEYRFKLPFVISASAAGTIIEWYDFYLYGVLAAFFSTQFFPAGDATAALLASLATFGAGFAVRPFGAAFFGRIGDIVGRKFTFLVTIAVMGTSTALVGILPTYAQIGVLAPIILVVLRLAQGLALGGEYGGAAIYVAEHSSDEKRGQNTSWIQTTATLGLLLALALIGITRISMSAADFTNFGWRIPFILSIVLVAMALYIRLRLQETPLFTQLKAEGKSSTSPWRDSFGNARQPQAHLARALRRDGRPGGRLVPGPVPGPVLPRDEPRGQVPGRLPDRRDRDRVGYPVLRRLRAALGSDRSEADHPRRLHDRGPHVFPDLQPDDAVRPPAGRAGDGRQAAGKFVGADGVTPTVAQPEILPLIALVWIQIIFVTMVYGPIAAFLVESFPARIRYTSLSIPYHIGNGWFGGFLPLIAAALLASTGNLYAGPDLSDRGRGDHGHHRRPVHPGVPARADLG